MLIDGGGSEEQVAVDAPPQIPAITAHLLAIVLGSLLFGLQISALNSCVAVIGVTFRWCDNSWEAFCPASLHRSGTISAVLYLGCGVGAYATGLACVKKLGVRRQLLAADLLFFLGAAACASAQGFAQLALGRGLSGLAVGIIGVSNPLYIGELSPPSVRGARCGCHSAMICVGILLAIAMGLPMDPPPNHEGEELSEFDSWYWRVNLAVSAPLAVLQAVLLLWVYPYETPGHLVAHGDVDGARATLCRMFRTWPAAARPGERLSAVDRELRALILAVEDAERLEEIKLISTLWDPYLRRAVLLGGLVACMQQLNGVSAFYSYSNDMFFQAGVPPKFLTEASLAMSVGNLVANFASFRVLDSWGRRKLLLWGTLAQGLCLVGLDRAVSGAAPPLVACLLFVAYVMAFSLGLGPVTFLYLSEIYPLEIRAQAMAFWSMTSWLLAFVVVYFTRFLVISQSCTLYAGLCITGTVLMYFAAPETKGCSMDDNPVTPRSRRASSPLLNSPKSPASPLLGPLVNGPKGPASELLLG